jgi:predicted dehydrogenase
MGTSPFSEIGERVERPQINVGIVGLGFMGVTHIKAYRQIPDARVSAICDTGRIPEDGDLSGISGNVGDKVPLRLDLSRMSVYRNVKDLLADPGIDLVDLCVPTRLHSELAVMSLRAGKHVLCEKPLARTAVQAREIVAAAAAARGYFMPAMCMRFWPGWLWAKQAIEQRNFGKVLAARFRRVCEPPAWSRETYLDGKQSGGALLDLHVHDTDFVQFCFGRPRSVYSRGTSVFTGDVDYLVTHYEVEGGAVVTAEGGWIMSDGFGFNMAYTVNFESATADYDFARGSEALKLFEKGRPPRTIDLGPGDGYLGELRHMIDAIRSGHPPTLVTASDGAGAVEICEAEGESIRTGLPVVLSAGM